MNYGILKGPKGWQLYRYHEPSRINHNHSTEFKRQRDRKRVVLANYPNQQQAQAALDALTGNLLPPLIIKDTP